mmetsp:Transcript_67476/g.107163  ORF Transcript_67476/g.107163 Transcript_67476/m.107163 type:complete len:205 (-) Transcript_67476:39-653(-)
MHMTTEFAFYHRLILGRYNRRHDIWMMSDHHHPSIRLFLNPLQILIKHLILQSIIESQVRIQYNHIKRLILLRFAKHRRHLLDIISSLIEQRDLRILRIVVRIHSIQRIVHHILANMHCSPRCVDRRIGTTAKDAVMLTVVVACGIKHVVRWKQSHDLVHDLGQQRRHCLRQRRTDTARIVMSLRIASHDEHGFAQITRHGVIS